jgi:hypothetical protein
MLRKTVICGKEVERLVDDAYAAPDAVRVDALGGDLFPRYNDPARVYRLDEVDASEQRGLARA